jgi:hypothetical protein
VAIVIVIVMITVMGVVMEYNSRRLKFSTFGKIFRPVGVATMDYGIITVTFVNWKMKKRVLMKCNNMR